ncbi:hypothetical protein G6L37_35115 [Agrobacterium rubi]|nr:hypothetical protein [Agrobacterium rubi]NTF23801.1 hypothetical protein [Agrobacterium rubi]
MKAPAKTKTKAKAKARTSSAHAQRIIDAVKVLMEYGLPDPVPGFHRNLDEIAGRPPREINPGSIAVPVRATAYSSYTAVAVDLSAVAPEKMLISMFHAAWQHGFEQGEESAHAEQHEAMIAAFPKLKDTIRELAEEVADKKIDEFRERFQNR